MEEYSRKIADAYGAFMRTGDPSVEGLAWPAFDLTHRATMVYDRVFHVESDPIRREREALDGVIGREGPVDCYTNKDYRFPLDKKLL